MLIEILCIIMFLQLITLILSFCLLLSKKKDNHVPGDDESCKQDIILQFTSLTATLHFYSQFCECVSVSDSPKATWTQSQMVIFYIRHHHFIMVSIFYWLRLNWNGIIIVTFSVPHR